MKIRKIVSACVALLQLFALLSVPTTGMAQTQNSEDVKLKFAVLSDLQYGRATQNSSMTAYQYAGSKFKNAARQVIEKAGGLDELDALLIPGDITHNSTQAEYQAFVSDLEEVIPPGSHTKVMFLRGNHDAKPNLQGNFVTYLSKYDPSITSANYVVDVNGYKFVMVSQDTQRTNDEASTYEYLHSPATISWFSDAMNTACAESEGKPVFVGMHPAVINTVYGSFPVEGMRNGQECNSSYWSTNELYDSLKNHSNAITFSGHSHWDIANEYSIHQKEFTSLNTGAVNNMEIEDCWDESFQPKRFGSNENECTGFYIEVDSDEVVTVHRMDFYRECEIKNPWVIDVNDKENWQYTDARDTTPPYFESDATATVSNITSDGCKVTFKQAKDDHTDVGHYKLELINSETGESDKTVTISSYYWQGSDTPEYNYWNVSGLSSDTEYVARLTAYDSFYTASSNVLESDTFKTAQGAEIVPIADISFNSDGIYDSSEFARYYGIEPDVFGTVPVSFDESINMYTASFERTSGETGSPNFFKVYLNNERKKLLSSGEYTIEVMFKPTKNQKDNNIIGAAQSSGFDLEANASGVFSAYLRHNGAWVSPKPGDALTIKENEYYHLTVTNDGSNIKVYNGTTLVDTTAASGALQFSDVMKSDAYYAMVVGGDYNPTKDSSGNYINQTIAQNAFTGNIAFVKLYGEALTAKEIADNCKAVNDRKSLTKLDELNTLIETTLPAVEGTEKVIIEAKNLLSKQNLTDAEIDEFIKKASDASYYDYPYIFEARDAEAGTEGAITGADYGITADTTNIIWSMAKLNTDNSLYTDAVRFTTRTPDTGTISGELMKLDFAKDTKNNYSKTVFKNGTYIYESEFALQYKDDGYLALNLNGRNPEGTEKNIATLKFAQSDGSYRYSGSAYMCDLHGNRVGKAQEVCMSTDDGVFAGNVFYVKAVINLIDKTYSVWLTPRKASGGAYTGNSVYDGVMLVENQPFNSSDVTVFSGMSFDITESTLTNGIYLNNIYVDKAYRAELSAVINALGSIRANQAFPASATISNSDGKKVFDMYIAVYGNGGVLKNVKKASVTGDGGISDSIIPDVGTEKICVYLWDSAMQTYDRKTVTADNN